MSAISDWFLTWWLHTGRYAWSKLRRRLFERGYLSTTLPEANSLAEIEGCLKEVTWTLDGPLHLFDSISYPETVWAKKKDDCDGFAVLASTLLKKWNNDIKSVLLTVIMSPLKRSHTVCVFSLPSEDLQVFDNASLHTKTYQSYRAVANQISKRRGRLICWDKIDAQKLETIEFHKA